MTSVDCPTPNLASLCGDLPGLYQEVSVAAEDLLGIIKQGERVEEALARLIDTMARVDQQVRFIGRVCRQGHPLSPEAARSVEVAMTLLPDVLERIRQAEQDGRVRLAELVPCLENASRARRMRQAYQSR